MVHGGGSSGGRQAGGAGKGRGGGGGGGGGSGPAAHDPGFQAVKGRVAGAAKGSAAHGSAQGKADEAGAAAEPPGNEIESQAEGRQVGEMAEEKLQPFNRAGFLAALRERIAQTAPKNLEEANDFKGNNNLASVKAGLTDQVRQGKEQAQGNLKKKAQEQPSTAGITPKPVTPLKPESPGSGPAKVNAKQGMPKAKPESEVTLKPQSQSMDDKMAEADITEPQLQKSNEPKFQSVLTAKKAAQADAEARPVAYRQQEQGILTGAQGEAEGLAQGKVQEMHGQREQALGKVLGKQEGAKGKDEQARAEVAGKIQQIYQRCKQKVEARLARLDGEVNGAFDQGAEAARAQFESYVGQRMDEYKDRRYSGLLGKGRWLKDKLMGMPAEVNAFYSQGRDQYLKAMEGTLERVATIVETGLREAQAEVARGKQEVAQYVKSLPDNLKKVGQQAAQEIQSQFSELEQTISNKEGELIDSLAQKYSDSLQQVDQRIDEMKAANRGLVDKAIGLIKDVYETIKKLKDLLLGVLSRAAGVIGKIIKDPIGFVGNLVAGAKAGFQGFVSRIGQHLQQGLLGWLTGALGGAGIQMPASFDLKGILSLGLQVMGVTYSAIRTRAVKMYGEKAVQRLEKASEIFKLLISGGPMAVWEHLKDKIGDLKTQVIGEIKGFVITRVIQAGVTWVLSMLNPASAFVRACKAIYDIVMFFIERAAQIAELVNAVLDSIEAVASGAVGAMAAKIEAALARAIPVVISFLASVLGLGGISTTIKTIIQRIQVPIQRGIDWVLKKAYDLVKKAGGFLKDKFSGKNKESSKKPDKDAALDPKKDPKKETDPDKDDDKSLKVKAKAGERMHAKRPFKTREDLEGARRTVLGELSGEGLKQLSVQEQGDTGRFDVIATASPPQKVSVEKVEKGPDDENQFKDSRECEKANKHGTKVRMEGGDPQTEISKLQATIKEETAKLKQLYENALSAYRAYQEAVSKKAPPGTIARKARLFNERFKKMEGHMAQIQGSEATLAAAAKYKPDLINVQIHCCFCNQKITDFDMVKDRTVWEVKCRGAAVDHGQLTTQLEAAKQLFGKAADLRLAIPEGTFDREITETVKDENGRDVQQAKTVQVEHKKQALYELRKHDGIPKHDEKEKGETLYQRMKSRRDTFSYPSEDRTKELKGELRDAKPLSENPK
jgi:hypothetical protein